jgi:hypothetical protein
MRGNTFSAKSSSDCIRRPVSAAPVLEREIEDAVSDLLAAALDLLDDRVGAAVERRRPTPRGTR